MEFDPVPHSHVGPVGYLRAWAHEGRIAMRRVDGSAPVLIGVRDAGVRKNFYRRTRPGTGEVIYDIEWSLGQAESAGLPVVQRLGELWPLELEDKGKVGQLFALQYLRGAAFKAWHERHVAELSSELRAAPERFARADIDLPPEAAIEEVIAHLSTDTYRLTKMLKITRSVGIVFASMHWSLVRFDAERLATSDHPVVVWPGHRKRSRPRGNEQTAGLFETLEAFVPVSPTELLLMTWRFDADTEIVLEGRGRDLATANAFVIANADKQWFHKPQCEPWLASGPRAPLSASVLDRYAWDEASASPRRELAIKLANAEMAAPLRNAPVAVVSVDRK